MKVYVPNKPFEENMPMVAEAIDRLGYPTIMAVIRNGDIYCLDGSHRVALMHSIGEIPNFIFVNEDHKFYFGYDQNYLVSEKNAPKWVKSDMEVQTASKVLEFYSCPMLFEFEDQIPQDVTVNLK